MSRTSCASLARPVRLHRRFAQSVRFPSSALPRWRRAMPRMQRGLIACSLVHTPQAAAERGQERAEEALELDVCDIFSICEMRRVPLLSTAEKDVKEVMGEAGAKKGGGEDGGGNAAQQQRCAELRELLTAFGRVEALQTTKMRQFEQILGELRTEQAQTDQHLQGFDAVLDSMVPTR